MKPSVYIETSIPSFYFEIRSEAEMTARRDWTREWWDFHRQRYEIYSSTAVIEELENGSFPSQHETLDLMSSVPLLDINEEIGEIATAYISHRLMPQDPAGDALHLAIASFHKCDFLITWNCRHLANANKYGHIRRVNTLLGLFVPTMATPMELLAEKHQDED